MKAQIDRLGVAALDYFFSTNGWLFREQITHDYGIDAHVEIVEKDGPTGKIVALQIKSGKSFFDEETEDGYVFRTDDKHVTYWTEHSMPVVIVLYDPESKQMYWQIISETTAESTGKNWKILVPKSHVFSEVERTFRAFGALTQPEPYVRKLNGLRIDRRWIERVDEGYEVRVSFDDWVNKSLPRFQLTISCEEESETWPMVYGTGMGIEAVLAHLLPWAECFLDRELHRQEAVNEWMNQCYLCRDPDGDALYTQPFDHWYQSPDEEIVPISSDGEVERYCLLLNLNELGSAFLVLDDYLSESSDFDQRAFTLD
ncbi:DUF4365 domain-containing protein [Paraburkholderia haematera]|uniref:DUF4365 domain-containing protein n=1 Tax=Paraburkholderia haematera TaxID=2793077 RepID=A0ABN7KDX7_9BURK|nr:DUF4365 domain-containing protein [Paraburkholderia haematera]CAE6687875.1 hypothetical protein R69888_00072 [Paraburkholderia haematera]